MNVLVSACLLGVKCRYDGKCKPNEKVIALKDICSLIPICPEIYGGLSTPRPPAERKDDKVVTEMGIDVTAQYNKGAEEAMLLAGMFDCKFALLKERSPSCGSGVIYDGTFSNTKTAGDGITAELLKKNGIKVFGESEIDLLIEELNKQ